MPALTRRGAVLAIGGAVLTVPLLNHATFAQSAAEADVSKEMILNDPAAPTAGNPKGDVTIVAFLDERPFHRFFPESVGANIVGGYSREKNWVILFDWRNVPQRSRSGVANMTTLAHEAMHQLCFNTGLLTRGTDIPLTIVEGFGMYAESRKLNGRSDLGRTNRTRLDELAHILRRREWMTVKELLVVDHSVLGQGRDTVELFYAESWLLVDYLMGDPECLPRFQAYLQALAKRFDASHRIDDAETYLGDLDRVDRDLRGYLVRLQNGA